VEIPGVVREILDTQSIPLPLREDEAAIRAALDILAEENPALADVIREMIAQLSNLESSPIAPLPPETLLPSTAPTIDPLSPCSSAVSGTGVAGSLITVTFENGLVVTTTVEEDGEWSATIPTEITLVQDETIIAHQFTLGYLASAPVFLTVLEDTGRIIKGIVSPIAYDDHGYGAEFLDRFTTLVQLRDPVTCAPLADTTVIPIGITGLGCFSFSNVPEGDYILYIFRPGYLSRTLAVHADADEGITEVSPPDGNILSLMAGDCIYNTTFNVVNANDVSLLEAVMGRVYPELGALAQCDFNADGVINDLDRDLLVANYYKESSDYAGNAGCFLH
jgi:hypothetical protein